MPMISFRRLTIASGLLLAFAAGPSAAQQPAFTPEQRKAIEALVRETILKNPEILQEALVELDRRNQTAQADAQKQAVKAEAEAIFNTPNQIVAGNPKGDVTLVEFFDYNCGFCKRALDDLAGMIKADAKLKVVLKDFPILGPDSVEASRVAIALKNQIKGDKYWDFHVKLMAQKGRINGEKALEVAREAGADLARLKKDLEAPETRSAITDIVALGDRLGLSGTPAFIVGDEVVFGAVGADALRTKIEAVRKCGKTTC